MMTESTPQEIDHKVRTTQAKVEYLQTRVCNTQNFLKQLWGAVPGYLSGSDIEALIQKNPEWSKRIDDLPFASMRSRHKIVRLALTLAAWDEISRPTSAHFTEAFCYRPEQHFFLD
jgi:hypothetical protein